MSLLPLDKQNIDNIPDENDYCFKCGGELEVTEEISADEYGMTTVYSLICIKCGQKNNWWEKEECLKKK